jgi:exoribonuclease-2
MNAPNGKFDFQRKAREEMIHERFAPDFPPQVLAEVQKVTAAPLEGGQTDLRSLVWSSIDNTESRDLDQIEWAEQQPNGNIRVLVGVADVDSVVKTNSATDSHARANATSVYTGGQVFAMLPEKLSTDVTSLAQDQDRPAIIMEFVVGTDGAVKCNDVSTAIVRNQARLNYDQVGKWLQGKAASPSNSPASQAVCDQLKLQNEAAKRLKAFRSEHGALALGGVESVPLVADNHVEGFAFVEPNAARDIIEGFMIAANVAMAGFLRARNALCLRRVVRTPKRWDRIQEIASKFGTHLPDTPDPRPLGEFLAQRRQADPDNFPELSLAILKSLGPGEYIVEHPGEEKTGHFGLAVNDYTHSTAPNRRYADLVMQRLLKAMLKGNPAPYSETELGQLATHCTERESAARNVERFMKKVAAAIMLRSQIGNTFDAVVTGVTEKGVFARLFNVPAEGRIVKNEKGLDIGQRVRVKLIAADPERGFIDLDANGR